MRSDEEFDVEEGVAVRRVPRTDAKRKTPMETPPSAVDRHARGAPGVTILGPEKHNHHDSLRAMLAGYAPRVAWIPDSASFDTNRLRGIRGKVRRVLDQFRGTRDRAFLRLALETIDAAESRFVIAYWGTVPLPDLVALKRARPHVKLVWMILCFPLTLTRGGIYRQRLLVRRQAQFLDGILYPSEEMAEYFRNRVLGGSAPPAVVIPPCWPESFQAAERVAPVSDRPNVVYVGRTDFSSHTSHAADDIRPLMRDLLNGGVEVYHGRSSETDDGHPNRKPFAPRPLLELISMMSGYDASLIAYNTAACAITDRFSLSIPDRLITSVTAGVPIAIPARGYEAARSYLREYPAVIPFDSPADLRAVLDDRHRVAELREAAWNARGRYAAERHAVDLRSFLDAL